MTELAAGAVSSLLVVVRNEALLLGGVRDDVQFIKEEMESMKSFLAHLARSTPHGREHDEQVRTWMNQVRLLAQDCHNCIDLYLYSGNPDIHRAKGKFRRYLWWVYWFLHKLLAQHRAAVQLRQLRDRARDVGERRLRYGVEVPAKPGSGQSPPTAGRFAAATASSSARTAGPGGYAAAAAAAGVDSEEEDDEEGDDDQLVGVTAGGHSGRRAFIDPRTLEEYVKAKLWEWVWPEEIPVSKSMVINIVSPYTYRDLHDLVQEIWVSKGIPYQRMVLVDIPAVHREFTPLRATELLFYILRELKQAKSQPQPQGDRERSYIKFHISQEKIRTIRSLTKSNVSKVNEKLDKIKSDIQAFQGRPKGDKQQDNLGIDVLHEQLLKFAEDQGKNKQIPSLLVKKLKEHMEAKEKDKTLKGEEVPKHVGLEGKEAAGKNMEKEEEEEDTTWFHLDEEQYVHILQKVFPKSMSSTSRPLQAEDRSFVGKLSTKNTMATLLGEDEIKQMIHDAQKDFLRELQEGKYGKGEGTGESAVPDKNPETVSEKIQDKEKIDHMIDNMKQEFEEQLKIKGLVEEIKKNLNRQRNLFILQVDELMNISTSTLEDTRNALSLLNSSCYIMIVTTTKEDIQVAKEYCYPQLEPIDYSLAGLYHDTIQKLTGLLQKKNEDEHYDDHHLRIIHDILDDCEAHEFCMKIFTHALYANPKRSIEELIKLHSTLRGLPASFNRIAKVMFKFSYNDLPKEYKSCLLYLAIFPPGHKIRRSTLIGRWVAEGLTSMEDWHSSMRQANRCFDALVDRCLVYPADISATGNVKSCVVGEPIHGIITTIARKQHILETRLSHHLARHFSIFNDLQLRSSDGIDKFFQGLSRSSLSVLKVLDLEGCECFTGGKNQRYLKDICRKMLLLKYLSLRRTDITQLPREINNLRELEVLDIRQTKVPPYATANVLLLKLKRLLAGNTDWTPRPTLRAQELVSTAVQIPNKIEKMVNMQILSNVMARSSQDLKDIGKLWQLRKLGVVVDDDPSYLKNLLRAISDLHECLCSLSITLPTATSKATPSQEFPEVPLKLKHQPKLLESLSISGTTQKGLLPLFFKDANNNLLKVTLSSTSLNKNNLEDLARLPKLQVIRLRQITDIESLVFKEEEFKYLKYLLVEESSFTNISFMDGAACMLEKIVLSSTNLESVSGVEGLPKLEEVELTMSSMSSSDKKNNDTLLSSFNNCKQMAKLTVVGSHEQDNQQNQSMINFNKGDFQKLRLLTVDCSAISKVVFTNGSAPKLEKIVWSSSTSLDGINNLPRLKELEFNGDLVPNVVEEAIKNHKSEPSLKHNKPEIQDQAKADEQEEDGDDHAAKLSLLCWKKQV